jgi:hypothetical protein
MLARGERGGKSGEKGATRRRKCILKNAPKALVLAGPGEGRWPMGRGGQVSAELGRSGQILGKIQMENRFKNFNGI